jgi:uncharacterized membrane protein YeaQ/YmgE (transglycosylase-associated protein family)
MLLNLILSLTSFMYLALINVLTHPVFVAAQGALGRSWLGTIVIGLVIGFVATFLTPGREPVGCIITMLIASVFGAILLLVIYHLIVRPGSSGRGPTV